MQAQTGNSLLVGLNYYDQSGRLVERRQFLGTVTQADPVAGTQVRLPQGDLLTLPPMPGAILVSPRGTYRCLISGDIVVDPDLITSWRITVPAEPGGAARWEPNYAPHFQSGMPEEWEFDYRHDPDFLKRLLAERGQAVVGQPLLVQLRRYEEREDETQYVGQEQLYGRIVRVSYAEGIVVQLGDGREYRLPPDLSLLQPAPPGERPPADAGQPDGVPHLLTMWTVHYSAEEGDE